MSKIHPTSLHDRQQDLMRTLDTLAEGKTLYVDSDNRVRCTCSAIGDLFLGLTVTCHKILNSMGIKTREPLTDPKVVALAFMASLTRFKQMLAQNLSPEIVLKGINLAKGLLVDPDSERRDIGIVLIISLLRRGYAYPEGLQVTKAYATNAIDFLAVKTALACSPA